MSALTTNIINCTPHPVNVYDEKGENLLHSYSKSEYVARCAQEPQTQVGTMKTASGKEIPVYSSPKFGDVVGLPICADGKECPDIIVSMVVGQALQESGQWSGAVLGPDTGVGAVRENGQIRGTTRLIQYCARKAIDQ